MTSSLASLERNVVEFRPEVEKKTKTVDLVAKGFPKRHVSRIPQMTGPSFDRAKELLDVILGGDSLIVLAGHRGPGKTQMATFWASHFKRPRYFKASRLMQLLRGEYSGDDGKLKESAKAISNAKKCQYLVLDEIAEMKWTDYERQEITTLLDERYDDQLSTVLITNTVGDEDIQCEIGYSAYSRAVETGGIVKCDWPSYRTV